jgi:hypothetical protein
LAIWLCIPLVFGGYCNASVVTVSRGAEFLLVPR